jgi:hypothetical protein
MAGRLRTIIMFLRELSCRAQGGLSGGFEPYQSGERRQPEYCGCLFRAG